MAGGEEIQGVNVLQASLLGKSFALKSVNNSKYMRFQSEEGERQGFVRFTTTDVVQEPRAKFEVEAADGGATKGMVHIRCCYNNKYLRRWDIDHHWIVAGGDKKVEDQTHWTCTLFEPVLETPADSDKDTKAVIRLRHVQLGRYVMQFTPHEDFKECLFPMSDKPYNGNYDLFEVLNWASLVVLPKYVAFKGNNGKYLKADPSTKQLRFNSTDIGEEGVAMEVESFADGYVRIKGFKHSDGLYWGTLPWWFNSLAMNGTVGSGTSLDLNTAWFLPVKVEDNVIALKQFSTHKFCRRGVTLYIVIGIGEEPEEFIANASSITEDTKLEMHEAVIKRTISMTYRLDDARVYNLTPVALDRFTHDNHDDHEISKTVTLTYRNDVTTNWEASNTWTVGVSVSIEVDEIPFISSVSVEMSASFGGSYTWGEAKTQGHDISESDVYTVRGRHRLTVSKLATRGHCDIPYSYVQTDYLQNGQIITSEKADGVFRGVNCFDIHTESDQTPL